MNPSKPFLWFAIFSCVVTVVALVLCNSSHKECHDRIINQNQAAFQSYNTILASMSSRIDTLTAQKQAIMLEIIEDSILNNLPKLPKKQKEALASYVESAVIAASMQIPYSSLLDNLEASVSSVQIANIQAETKALLELEFNKIQNEYETLALWAGILTVVFLIFSFYSMFKTEELLKQGKQGLSELDDIKERGEGRVADFTERSGESLREFKVRYLTAISEIRDGDARRLDGLEISINKITQMFTEETQKKISVVQKYVENTKKSIDEQYMKMSDSSAKIETKLTEKLGIMDKTIKEQAGMMGRMKQQMDVLQTMVETMKRKE